MIQTAEELASLARRRCRLCGAGGAAQQSLSGAAGHNRGGSGRGQNRQLAQRPRGR